VRSVITLDPERKPAVEPSSPSHFGPREAPPAALPQGSLMKGTPLRDSPPFAWQYAPGETQTSGPAQVATVELSLDQALLVIRNGDKRFVGLRHQLRGREVYLSGSAANWDDVMALARAVARLPGIERVVLSQVRTSSSPE
jgi:hypothetical protein